MKTALFIDGPNLYATAKVLGIDIDFKRLKEYYGEGLVRAYYYTATNEEGPDDYQTIRPLIDWLVYNGYTLVTKPTKQFLDTVTGRTKVKGNMDCELTVDALTLAFNRAIDHAVFFTGDGDFKALFIAMQQLGVRCTVVSSIETKPAMCADELRRQADSFIDLVHIAQYIARAKNLSEAAPRASRYASART